MIDKSQTILTIGGPSGVGKSSVSYEVARRTGRPIVEADDLFHGIEALTTPDQQPWIHFWRTQPEAAELSPDNILALHLEVCRAMSPAITSVINNHIETRMPIILEGDYILPEMIVPYTERVKGVFLYEEDATRLRATSSPASQQQENSEREQRSVNYLEVGSAMNVSDLI